MQRQSLPHFKPRLKIARLLFCFQLTFTLIVVFVSASTLVRLYSSAVFLRGDASSGRSRGSRSVGHEEAVSILGKISELQTRVKKRMEHNLPAGKDALLEDVLLSLDLVQNFLLRLRIPRRRIGDEGENMNASGGMATIYEGDVEDEEGMQEEKETAPSVDFFLTEEIRKYLRVKENRYKKKNFMGVNGSVGTIGHACVSMKSELEEYMDYDVGDYCKDDWPLAQKLMVSGCDPLPRRRCIARGPPLYQKPLPRNESLWEFPDDRNIRWTNYRCRNFQCLRNGTRRGFFKCSGCFDLKKSEASRWVANSSLEAEFKITDVLNLKPGEIRIGLDFSIGVGTFAARMLEHNVTIVSATLNLGAPFNELISLRGLVPLFLSLSQRLPFFDNTLDILHTTLILDGWIDLQFLDFIIFDWDRVLRPGGLLWIDRFFCAKIDVDDFLYLFLQLRYKRRMWVVTPMLNKGHDEVYFSAVLEKPPRPF